MAVHLWNLVAQVGGKAAGLAPLPEASGSLAGELFRVLGVLLGLIGLVLLGLQVLRRVKFPSPGGTPLIRVLGSRPLSPRQALWVVAVDRQRFLLASSPERVELLAALPPGEEPAGRELGPAKEGA